jgi:hypothetical protein
VAKDEGENLDFDDFALPDAPLDFDGESLVAGEATEEASAPLLSQPLAAPQPVEAAAADPHEERYAQNLRAAEAETKANRAAKKEARRRSRPSFWEALSRVDLYTVMLGVALLAVTLAVLCLLGELASYRFDIKAKAGKTAIPQVSWATQSGCASTMPLA